jgi:hypothetical protein
VLHVDLDVLIARVGLSPGCTRLGRDAVSELGSPPVPLSARIGAKRDGNSR